MRMIRPNLFSYKAKFQLATFEDWQSRPIAKTFVDIISKVSKGLDPRSQPAGQSPSPLR
jgi:hypothetical protein